MRTFFTSSEKPVFSKWLSREIFLLNISVYLSLFFWPLTCEDSISLETNITIEATSENKINKVSVHLLTVSGNTDPDGKDTDVAAVDPVNTTNDDTVNNSGFLLVAAAAEQ